MATFLLLNLFAKRWRQVRTLMLGAISAGALASTTVARWLIHDSRHYGGFTRAIDAAAITSITSSVLAVAGSDDQVVLGSQVFG
jgi:hypothetical protein